jgi:hypothetical protein
MGVRKGGLSIDQHRQIAADLLMIRGKLETMQTTLTMAYPLTVLRLDALRGCIETIDVLRSQLRDVVIHQFPKHTPSECVSIYYPYSERSSTS